MRSPDIESEHSFEQIIRVGIASIVFGWCIVSCDGSVTVQPSVNAGDARCEVGEEYKQEQSPAVDWKGNPVDDMIEFCVNPQTGDKHYLPDLN